MSLCQEREEAGPGPPPGRAGIRVLRESSQRLPTITDPASPHSNQRRALWSGRQICAAAPSPGRSNARATCRTHGPPPGFQCLRGTRGVDGQRWAASPMNTGCARGQSVWSDEPSWGLRKGRSLSPAWPSPLLRGVHAEHPCLILRKARACRVRCCGLLAHRA